ncbi:MAG: adenylate/guanylate cyclase domain-containing protein [Coxiellaceae bacterium]|nr:adenylate/guanylate cyclase domain-containing protein [Coxiellaceae bacterium]
MNKLSRAKFTIRLSILSILLILLIGVSALIISINYFTTNSILIASAKNSLFQSSGRVAEQVRNYLQPLNVNVLTASHMFLEGVANPNDADFTRFLYSLISDDENLVGAYWCDVKGNMYWLNKTKTGFVETVILRNDNNIIQATKKSLDNNGVVLTTAPMSETEVVDYRLRPWYLQAALNKDLTWIVYRFIETGDQKPQYGITSAFPIYDTSGNLQGVFGVDMLLDAITDYVKNIELTANSHIFIVDNYGNIITSHTPNGELLALAKNSVKDKASDIQLPWISKSFKLYKEKQESPFIYLMNGKQYVASYEKIVDVKSNHPWFVGIVTPISDIIKPLLKGVLISVIFTGLVLLLGIILASIFSLSLSRPIKRLAQDANLICQLQLADIKYLFSRIKEIAEMADSFMKLKNALYSFQRYMPIVLVKKLIVSNKVATVGGGEKDLTLLFTDIQDFTQLSEGFAPEELMHYLSEYFQTITKVIIDMYGTVDKYIGDGLMAFWGAPIDDLDHTQHACQAALQMQKVLQQLNLKWQKENKPAVITRFGISSGNVVIGNVGSDDRLSYTSLGDPVNLASRLEGLNKIYGTTIMVSEFVYEKVKDQFKFRLLDRVAVKGKKQNVRVYELLGEKDFQPNLYWEQYNQEFYRAFSSYESGDWSVALNLFNDLHAKYPDDRVVNIFITRCSEFIANPPPAWDGVWIMNDK